MTKRNNVKDLEDIIGKKFPVLDKGHLIVRDYMGCDESIANAARISYQKGTKKVSEDRTLIRYLMRHRHTSPIEQCSIQFEIKAPLYVIQQWLRHRTGKFNAESHRYSESTCEFEVAKTWRKQSTDNKQGSKNIVTDSWDEKILHIDEALIHDKVKYVYQSRLNKGVSREQARKELPVSTYSKFVWKTDLHNLLHFLSLRMDSHAQEEIREYANKIGEIVSKWCPIVWEGFQDYRLNAQSFTATEIEMLKSLIDKYEVYKQAWDRQAIRYRKDTKKYQDEENILIQKGLLKRNKEGKIKRNRERGELETKLKSLGIKEIPWDEE